MRINRSEYQTHKDIDSIPDSSENWSLEAMELNPAEAHFLNLVKAANVRKTELLCSYLENRDAV